MKDRRYDPGTITALAGLTELALERERTSRLEEAERTVGRWKRGRIAAAEALEELRRTAAVPDASWHKDADPGVPVAYAVAVGLLTRDDIPDGVWNSIEVLITLAGI